MIKVNLVKVIICLIIHVESYHISVILEFNVLISKISIKIIGGSR